MQDWEWEVADPKRFEEFLAAYTTELPADQRVALMEILVQCVEDSDSESQFALHWDKIEPLLAGSRGLHARTIEYWSCLGAEHPEEMFRVTKLMRQINVCP